MRRLYEMRPRCEGSEGPSSEGLRQKRSWFSLCSVHETTVRAGGQSERCSEHQVRRPDSDMDHRRARPEATHRCLGRSLASVLVGEDRHKEAPSRIDAGVQCHPKHRLASNGCTITFLAPLSPSWNDRLVYTVTEAAQLLGVSRASAYELVARGEIPVIRLGRRILIPKTQLLALLELP